MTLQSNGGCCTVDVHPDETVAALKRRVCLELLGADHVCVNAFHLTRLSAEGSDRELGTPQDPTSSLPLSHGDNLQLFTFETNVNVGCITVGGPINVFSASRGKVAIATGQEVHIQSLEDGTDLNRLARMFLLEVHLSPCGRYAVTCGMEADLWDLETTESVTLSSSPPLSRMEYCYHAAFTPLSDSVAVSEGVVLALFDLEGVVLRVVADTGLIGVAYLKYTGCGKHLICALPKQALNRVYPVEGETRDLIGTATNLDATKDTKWVVGCGTDGIRVWRFETAECVVHEFLPAAYVAATPCSQYFAASSGCTVCLRSLPTAQKLRTIQSAGAFVMSLSITDCGRYLIFNNTEKSLAIRSLDDEDEGEQTGAS